MSSALGNKLVELDTDENHGFGVLPDDGLLKCMGWLAIEARRFQLELTELVMTRNRDRMPRRNSRPSTSQARKTTSNAKEVLPNHFDVTRAYRLNPSIREGRYYLAVDGCSLQLLTPSSDEGSWLDLPEASYVAVLIGDCYHCGHVEDYELYWEYDGFIQTLTLEPAQCDNYLAALEPGKMYPLTAYEPGPDGDVRPVRTWSAELCWSG